MVSIPLGHQAYKRAYAGSPEIRLENRYLEKSPTNLIEQVSLIPRAGTPFLASFDSGGLVGGDRSQFSKVGLFDGDLFVAMGPNLYRYATDGTKTHIVGLLNGIGPIAFAWMKGIGYEYLFIADGLLLQVYNGGSHATNTLTTANPAAYGQVIEINGIYYGWNAAVDTNAPDGSAAHPWLANPGTDPLLAMSKLINFDGVRGVDFSTALGGPNPQYSAAPQGGPPATSMKVSATTSTTFGNSYTASVYSGTGVSWAGANFTGGAIHVLQGVEMPDGDAAKSLAGVSGFVLVSVGFSQKFYYILPGEIVIDPLNYAEKESNPDNINDMLTIGDQVMIVGAGSTENWYASGDFNAPLLPVEGRVYRRGCVDGTTVAIKDSVLLVGDDLAVYAIGQGGESGRVGVHKISTNAIDERIRVQIRREQGL